eukprot:GILI01009196.1.p1 GENE.GILI01009196.1~~GILI01009196.1.p1  ORF type:complete len:261 (+),score=90.54 GILI01009196.1:249-1031(+)
MNSPCPSSLPKFSRKRRRESAQPTSARRLLFEIDEDELQQWRESVEAQNKEEVARFVSKWNFDVESEQPLDGRFEWSPSTSSSQIVEPEQPCSSSSSSPSISEYLKVKLGKHSEVKEVLTSIQDVQKQVEDQKKQASEVVSSASSFVRTTLEPVRSLDYQYRLGIVGAATVAAVVPSFAFGLRAVLRNGLLASAVSTLVAAPELLNPFTPTSQARLQVVNDVVGNITRNTPFPASSPSSASSSSASSSSSSSSSEQESSQ